MYTKTGEEQGYEYPPDIAYYRSPGPGSHPLAFLDLGAPFCSAPGNSLSDLPEGPKIRELSKTSPSYRTPTYICYVSYAKVIEKL